MYALVNKANNEVETLTRNYSIRGSTLICKGKGVFDYDKYLVIPADEGMVESEKYEYDIASDKFNQLIKAPVLNVKIELERTDAEFISIVEKCLINIMNNEPFIMTPEEKEFIENRISMRQELGV